MTHDRIAETVRSLATAPRARAQQVRLVEVGLHWVLDQRWIALRDAIDAVVEAGVLMGRFARVRRVVLYDAPGAYVAEFLDEKALGAGVDSYRARADEDLHEMVASRLGGYRDHLEMWLALATNTRQMTFERTAQCYEVKMWILGPTAASTARRQADDLPTDLLLYGRETDDDIAKFDEWFDRRWDVGGDSSLIWLNGAVEVLDPTGGFDASGHFGRNVAAFEPRG